jgi:hypothetical protein
LSAEASDGDHGAVFAAFVVRFEFDGSNPARLAAPFEKSQRRTTAMEPSEKQANSRQDGEPRMSIEQQAYHLVNSHHHFRRRAGGFEFRCDEDILVVRGSVPTFYLKQVLQSVLRDLEGVRGIDNQVMVVSSRGLSSLSGD